MGVREEMGKRGRSGRLRRGLKDWKKFGVLERNFRCRKEIRGEREIRVGGSGGPGSPGRGAGAVRGAPNTRRRLARSSGGRAVA